MGKRKNKGGDSSHSFINNNEGSTQAEPKQTETLIASSVSTPDAEPVNATPAAAPAEVEVKINVAAPEADSTTADSTIAGLRAEVATLTAKTSEQQRQNDELKAVVADLSKTLREFIAESKREANRAPVVAARPSGWC
jgi:activator of HSP90 ATPase